jgi:phospholipid/cholesterol/gamma-HCH transport system ATP-binding protein
MTSAGPSKGSYAVEFRNVSISFDDRPALVDVSFKLRSGAMIILTGESGSGKSVLLRLAMGLEKPDAGEILINGRDISSLGESDLLAIRGGLMGMVFQEDSLFTGLSVYDNVAYRLDEHGWSEEDTDKAVHEVLRFVGLDGEDKKLPEELSGGMKRRLEIARALVGWPSIMLFDEPTMSLDPIVALQVLDLVIRARDINRISSIYVSKKPMEIPYLAGYVARGSDKGIVVVEASAEELPDTTIIVLEKGRIVFIGSLTSFESSNLPSVRRVITLDPHHDALDVYYKDPWDKSRVADEKLL